MMLTKILKNRVIKNAGWIVAGRVGQMIISLMTSLLTARYLGPSNYGLISYAGAYVAFFTSICTLGINNVLVKEIFDNHDNEGVVMGTSLLLRLLASLMSFLTIVCISFFIDGYDSTAFMVVVLCSFSILFNVFDFIRYWFQSKLLSKITALVTLVAYFITSVYKLFLIFTGKSVFYFALSNSVDFLIFSILIYIMYRKKGGSKFRFSFPYACALLKKSYHFILPGLMVSVYAQTDKIMLKNMISTEEIGFYSTAVNICNIWVFVLTAIIDSMYPTIVEAFKVDKDKFKKRNMQLYAIVFYLSVFVSFGIAVLAGPIIYILYGSAYMPAVSPLRIITWYTAFSYLGVARNAWIVCMDKQNNLKYIYVGAAISNVILNLLLIPSFGAEGAALASLSAQIITTFVIPFFIKDLKENSVLMLKAILFKFNRD